MSQVVIRPAVQEDVNFIFKSILNGRFRQGTFAKNISDSVFFTHHQSILEATFKVSNIQVAVNSEDLNQIIGFMIAENHPEAFIVHYIYVKAPFRRMGVAKMLINSYDNFLDENGKLTSNRHIMHTHDTVPGFYMSLKYGSIYNPYLFFLNK